MDIKFTQRKSLTKVLLMTFMTLFFSASSFAQCFNTSAYGSATANFVDTVTISTCNYQSEYSTVSGFLSGYPYTARYLANGLDDGFITVSDGTGSSSAVIAEGPSPLSFTAGTATTLYIHWTIDSLCNIATNCGVTQIIGNTAAVPGCTDTAATNYNPLANVDDGSCAYPVTCVAIAPYTESFSSGILPVGTCTGGWASSVVSGDGWRFTGNPGYNATSNGRASGTYAWVDFSGVDAGAILRVEDIDISGLSTPTLGFDYFSDLGTYTLTPYNILYVEAWDGASWGSIDTLQLNVPGWNSYFYPLSNHTFSTNIVRVRFRAESGGASLDFYNDLLLDEVKFMELPALGCTDPFASNFDSTANVDDGSCLYPGCLDIYANNYCSTCNVNDSTQCTYNLCNVIPFSDDFEASNLSGTWATYNGSQSSITLARDSTSATDTVSLTFTGSSSNTTGYGFPTSEAAAFALTDHVAGATVCLDLSGATGIVNLTFDAVIQTYYSNNYAWFRVNVDGTTINDVNSVSSYTTNGTVASTTYPRFAVVDNYIYDLSAYAGQQINLTFETSVNRGPGSLYEDYVRFDNISVETINPCTYYVASASVDSDVSCNGGSDGSASAGAVNGVLGTDSVSLSFLWSDGQTSQIATGLSAGTYYCTVTDSVNGCSSQTSAVTIAEPSAVTASIVTQDATNPTTANGTAAITVSGGTPCITALSLSSHNPAHSTNGQSGIHFNISNTSGTDLTVTSLSQGSYSYSGTNSMSVWYNPSGMGAPSATGWTQVANGVALNIPAGGNFATPVYSLPYAITPVVIPAGATYGFYIQGTSTFSYATATASGPVGSSVASDGNISITSGYGGTPLGTGLFSPRAPVIEVFYGDPNAQAYTIAWSTGDSTSFVDSLAFGPISATVTDCNGCQSSFSSFVGVSLVPGCMDPTAWNYNPNANVSDSSCIAVAYACLDTLAVNYVAFDSTSANTSDTTLCCYVAGCTNPLASNYDALACFDDNSCNYCDTSSVVIAPVSESFESATSIFTQATYDNTNWTWDAGGTTSSATGPQLVNPTTGVLMNTWSPVTYPNGSADGDYYMYLETSGGIAGNYADITSPCIDVSQLSSPAIVFNYHMYGATISSLELFVNGTLAWSQSGAQGSDWKNGVVDLSTYGSTVTVTLRATRGASFSGDIAIDHFRVEELPASGCTDSLACNYDPTATLDDGSCFTLSVSADGSVTSCNGNSDGTLSATSNDTTVTYSWDNGATTSSQSGLGAGTYVVTVTNSLGCTATDTAVISDPAVLSLSTTVVDETSASASDGSIDLTVSGGTGCQVGATVTAGSHLSNYNGYARGWSFTAQSSFILSYVKASDGNTTPGLVNQSIEILDITAGTAAGQYVSLFYAQSQPVGWLSTGGISIVQGNTYAIVGAKETDPPGSFGAGTSMNNSYGPSGQSWVIDGIPTPVSRCGSQGGLASGQVGAGGGAFLAPTTGSIGRVDIMTGIPGASPYFYAWSTGDTTEDLTNLTAGTYSVTVTDCNGCSDTISATVSVSATPGCTDPTAWNYDPTANLDDGSCIAVTYGCFDTTAFNYTPFDSISANTLDTTLCCYISGCTDPFALNYNPSACFDDGSCLLQTCNLLPFNEDWEDSTTTTGSWLISLPGSLPTTPLTLSSTQLSYGPRPLAGLSDVALEFTGGETSIGWSSYTTEAQVFANTSHVQTATVCLDLSSATGGVIMDFDYLTESGFGNTSNVNGSAYSTFRVKVNGTVIQDISGVQWHGLETLTNLSYDLSSYAGQSSVYVTWEAACKYSAGYSLGTYGDYVWIDNINVNSGAIFGCTDTLATNYDSLATNNNGSCIYPCYVAPWSSSFEDGIASIAITPDDWTNTSNPGWLRNTIPFGGTPSSSTGPLSAHDGGYFLFTEASGAVAGSERTLVSHCMDISSLVQPEFSMRIHMFGQSMGSMYLFGSGDAGSTWDTLWSATGQQQTAQSDPWIEVTADLSAYSSTGVTMKITGYMGTSFWSDMAIDYTQVYDANIVTGCTDSTASNYDPLAVIDDGSCVYPGCTAAPYYENFDAGMGSFTTANTGTGTYPGWLMGTSTPSFGTGPTGDVTGGSFMYIETSGLGGPYTLTSE
ncbi:hypothetical protein OA870_04535, partial [Bacteroidota bacterium]|nr:hypothetical protein [Bacteroidota bacterium]